MFTATLTNRLGALAILLTMYSGAYATVNCTQLPNNINTAIQQNGGTLQIASANCPYCLTPGDCLKENAEKLWATCDSSNNLHIEVLYQAQANSCEPANEYAAIQNLSLISPGMLSGEMDSPWVSSGSAMAITLDLNDDNSITVLGPSDGKMPGYMNKFPIQG